MPELPEVETVVRDLRTPLVGRRFTAIESGTQPLRKPWQRNWEPVLLDKQVLAVERRGKWLLINLEADHFLVVHLGMTGQLTVRDAITARETHTHLIFSLDDGRQLRFRDIRRFGSATVFVGSASVQSFFVDSGLGPEPFDLVQPAIAAAWQKALRNSNRVLKAILLDQTIVAGVGNIYADEALFHARLHPTLRGTELRTAQASRLKHGIIAVLEKAIQQRGSTIRDYVGGSGLRGGFQEELNVYGRTGEPCKVCTQPIACMRLAGRSTHYCPHCQRKRTPS